MAFKVNTEVDDYEQVEPGLYPGACIWILDLGLQPGFNEGSFTHQIFMNFEVATPGEITTIGAFYSVSFGAKANLGNMLRGWMGKKDLPPELDLETFLGHGCNLHVVPSETGKSKIGAVMNGDYKHTMDVLTTADHLLLPEWFQDKIKEGAARLAGKQDKIVGAPGKTPPADLDDDIPF